MKICRENYCYSLKFVSEQVIFTTNIDQKNIINFTSNNTLYLYFFFVNLTPKQKSSGVDNWYQDEFLKNSTAADDIFIQSRRYIIYVCRLVVDYHPQWLNIICCGRLSAMLHDIHLQQTIFN
jgi:hypothetical protein